MRCDHCGTRIGDDPFSYRDLNLCCGCMYVLCSWFLDGGMVDAPEMFPDLVEDLSDTK